MNVRFGPSGALRGDITAPPDKSLSHRAAMLGAMCSEPVVVRNYLAAEDTHATLDAVRALGALVEERSDELVIRGVGLRNAEAPDAPIDVGNAGTLMRLLPGWLAAQDGRSYTLDGDQSIRRRPVDRIAEPLELMGARIEATGGRLPPFTVHGARLKAIDYAMPVASGQVKSCTMFAALMADGQTTITEPAPSRDHTERMLARAGVPIGRAEGVLTIGNVDELEFEAIDVPSDLSSAAFMIAAGILVPGSRLLIRDVNVNWTRAGFLRIAERMGAIVLGEVEEPAGAIAVDEPISDLDVAHGPLAGTTVEADEVPLAIDELPLVALLGCFAEGETVVRGAGELRLKESDRIAGIVDGLNGLGGDLEATDDGFVVRGTGGLRGGTIDSLGDHRLAMVGAVAGLASSDGVEVVGMEAAAVSYPRFGDDIAALT